MTTQQTPEVAVRGSEGDAELVALMEHLAEVEVFQGLSPETLLLIARESEIRPFGAGEIIVEEGKPWDAIILVHEGRVKIDRSRGGLWHQILGELGVGKPLSMVPVLDGGAAPASVEALEDGSYHHIPGDAIRKAIAHDPPFAIQLLRSLSLRVRRLANLIGELSLLTLEERLIYFVIRHAPHPGPEEVRPWSFTHADIAQRIGGCREEVTRLLSKLRRKGLIHVRRREVRILDVEGLKRLAPRLPTFEACLRNQEECPP